MPRPKTTPEPLRLGDEQVAREEIEAYYARQIETARKELVAAQERFDRESAQAEAAVAAFRAGERLPKLDAWAIEVNAGQHSEIGLAILNGRSTDRAAYDRAKARNEATNRWLRHEGYESVEEAR